MDETQIIIEIVCDFYKTTPDTLKSGNRKLENIKAVHIIWYFCKIHTKIPYSKLAKLMARKSHCDIIHAVKSVRNQLQTNKYYREEINYLSNRINERLYPETFIKNYMQYKIMSIM